MRRSWRILILEIFVVINIIASLNFLFRSKARYDKDIVPEESEGPIDDHLHEEVARHLQPEQPSREKCDQLCSKLSGVDSPLQLDSKGLLQMDPELCGSIQFHCGLIDCHRQVIDVVYLWVNGSDPELNNIRESSWNQRTYYEKKSRLKNSNSKRRYREMGQLRYSLRSLERHVPWARRIFIVTDGQVPSYLYETDKTQLLSPRIRIVDHSELMVNHTKAPHLFNSMAIQSMVHSINGISRPFLYCEDDILFLRNVPIEVMFNVSTSKPIYYFGFHPLDVTYAHLGSKEPFMNSAIKSYRLVSSLGKLPDTLKAEVRRFHLNYWMNTHGPMMLDPVSISQLWKEFPDPLSQTLTHPFREDEDPHFWTLLMYYWAMKDDMYELQKDDAEGYYKSYFNTIEKKAKIEIIRKELLATKSYFACLNDDFDDSDENDDAIQLLNDMYQSFFPFPSLFEVPLK